MKSDGQGLTLARAGEYAFYAPDVPRATDYHDLKGQSHSRTV